MKITQIIVVGISAFAISFLAGRTSQTAKERDEVGRAHSPPTSSASALNAPNSEPSKHVLEVYDFGTAQFPELYRTLRSASPRARLGWAKQIEQMRIGPRRHAAVCSFYKTLVQIDAQTAAEALAQCKDEVVAAIGTGALIGAAPTSAMEQVATVLIHLPVDHDRPMNFRLNDVIAEWSAVDPVAVAKFFDQQRSGKTAPYYPELVGNWAMMDPEAAKNWLQRQEPATQTDQAIFNLLNGWFSNDKQGALEFAIANSTDERFQRSIYDLSSVLFVEDRDKARDFILRLTNRDIQSAALQNLIFSLPGPTSPDETEHFKPSAESLTKWVLTFPSEMWAGLGSLTVKWDEEDSVGFASWVRQLPVEKRDRVLSEYCLNLLPSGSDRGFSAAMQISDSTQRDQSLRILVNSLGDTREEIEHALRNSHLSSAEKAHLATFIANDHD